MSGLPHSLYERARLLGAPGVEATIRLNPTGLSTRMRNAVIKSLHSGVVVGGWSSKARKLTELILKSRQLQYIELDRWYVTVKEPLTLPPDAEFQALQMLKTDFAVARLNDKNEYTLRSRKETIDRLEKDVIGSKYNVHFRLDPPYDKEFASLLASNLPEWETKERNKLADDILAGRTITIQE
jgi:hypothetical protein